ncbi:hypothetical protein M422DRAFT_249493 [Sphaerobolus stellatus SS14]|uniref:Uncharacterized protein n=1 Tax=Sphaerobolus stellatus (strain SS14) TaxID=990650 RepID=A0A0C9W3T0_SPHS4|nr:hypothetical protein M422DRAFT_249493 [Sphaerobolus stellatus SS14]
MFLPLDSFMFRFPYHSTKSHKLTNPEAISYLNTIARTDKAKATVAASTGRNLRSCSQPPSAATASSIVKISKKTLIRKRTIASPSPLQQSIILLPIEETQSARPAAGPSSIHEPEALPYIPDLTPSRSPSPSQHIRSPSPAHSTQSCPTDFTITRHAIPSYQLNPSPALQFPSFAAEDNLPDSRYNSLTRSPSPTLETPSSLPSTSQNSNLETPFPSDPSSPINTFPGSPSIIPAHRMTTLATGRAAMPAPGLNRAPKTFDGSEDDIADFLKLFENCADDAQLPDKEKEQIITEDEHDRYYWFGFHKDTRKILEQRLTTTIPDHPRSKAYRSTDVFRAGKYLFDVDTFDRNPPEGFAPPDSESKPQGGTSESKPQGGSVEVMTRTVTLPDTPTSAPVSHNMEDLLLRIRSLNVRELEYAATYAKIQAASPITVDLLKQPYGTVNSAMTTTVFSLSTPGTTTQAQQVCQGTPPDFRPELSLASSTLWKRFRAGFTLNTFVDSCGQRVGGLVGDNGRLVEDICTYSHSA